MKRLLMLLCVPAMIIAAAPAYADDDAPNNDLDFLKQVKDAGLSYKDGSEMVKLAKSACALADSGEDANDISRNVESLNPSLEHGGAVKFLTLASAEYCPKHMHG